MRATAAKPAALSLLDGELLEDLDGVDTAFDNWLAAERERLRDRARGLAEQLLREQSEPDGLIAAAQQLLIIDRTHEGAWRGMMRAYTARGERGMAIQAYERCRTVLADQLDAQPSDETQRLANEIRATAAARAAAVSTVASPAPPARPEQRPSPRAEQRADTRGEQRGEANVGHHATRGGARVGVLPLQVIGTTEAEAHLSTGLAEEITSALARFRWMFLVSSSSLARFATQTRDEGAIRRAFDLHFLLDGTIQRANDRLRISMRLLDLRAGNQVVWSRRFDRESDDLLTLQDEIAAEAVAQIDPELLLIESQRVAARPVADASAYDMLLRALSLMDRLERPLFVQAGELLRQAITLEPDYAAAHAWYAYWHVLLVGQGWAKEPSAVIAQAGRLAERAVTLDPQDAKALTIAGHVRAYLHHRLREAITLHERALTFNPNLAMAWGMSGVAFAYLGDLDEAERRLQRYKKLSPLDPYAFLFDTGLAFVALLKGQYGVAAEIGRGVSEMNPAFSAACKPYLAALGHLGQLEEARSVGARLLMLEPGFSVQKFISASAFQKTEHRDLYAQGLRLAGLPEA
jgi:TolB-like protein